MYPSIPAEARRAQHTCGHLGSCSIRLCLTLLRQFLSLKSELGWWPASPSDPPVSAAHSAGWVQAPVQSSSTFYVGAGNLTTGPQACTVGPSSFRHHVCESVGVFTLGVHIIPFPFNQGSL